MVVGIVRHTGFDRHLCFGRQWPADERFDDVSTDCPPRIEHRPRLHNGNGGVCRTRVERALHLLVKALEEPSGIVQDAGIVCENPRVPASSGAIEAHETGAKLISTSAPELSHTRH